jgi:hypothetical protein
MTMQRAPRINQTTGAGAALLLTQCLALDLFLLDPGGNLRSLLVSIGVSKIWGGHSSPP